MPTPQSSQCTIALVDDEPSIRKLVDYQLANVWGYHVRQYGDAETFLAELNDELDAVILDVMLPGMSGVEALEELRRRDPDLPVIVLSAQDSVETAVRMLKLGAIDYLGKPVDNDRLEASLKTAIQLRDLSREVGRLRERMASSVTFENVIAGHGEMQEVFRLVNKVKDSDIVVLIMGESGTGKELIARAVHYHGRRKNGPFVVVNCASIPHDLLESELFGHEKGSFTGAAQRRLGRFESAHGGTIFLDEIGEMDQALQAKLLRVIQTKQFERVGGNETISTDVRIISATNRDLKKEVEAGRFREDLYYRLATFPILLPPLRQRRSDVLLLAEHFLRRYAAQENKPARRFSREALRLLYGYPWPGNVRELENAIQRAVVMSEGEFLTEEELPVSVQSFSDPASASAGDVLSGPAATDDIIVPMEKMEEIAVRNALRICGGNSAMAAKRLGIGRATLYRMVKRYGIGGGEGARA
jgi:DNA-binding NtrC family response regulator